jgi:hypothetical protein
MGRYRYVGLRVLQYAWLDLNALWALSLIVSGAAALASSLPGSALRDTERNSGLARGLSPELQPAAVVASAAMSLARLIRPNC